ncbi:hypothetical protein NIES21_50980 [Anabaenopsis circularis NIES-21]|uniref:Uncharacterized protein n=1 Tax=Anabaenopsis circularis NIES-21 TaxID=1085406 RepID=A0A1Z4GPH1_9CYAN|nr:hypothetical protein NIES21_50980 [Anabaenopsis circularis NIES-21]
MKFPQLGVNHSFPVFLGDDVIALSDAQQNTLSNFT